MGLQVDSIEQVFPLADFIAEIYGELNEVVVHDVKDVEASIVYIRNGHLSGRKIGDGATDLALKIIQEGRHSRKPFIANYSGRNMGGRRFRCATLFIRDRADRLLGLLCVNVDVTCFDGVISVLKTLNAPTGACTGDAACRTPLEETLQGDPRQTIRRIARGALAAYPLAPARLTRRERVEALRKIMDDGAFLMKGAVPIVAEEMGISQPTLYKYLQEIKERGSDAHPAD